MQSKGYLLLVLHTHQPFVRHPELQYSLEEDSLFEAITQSYIPLLEVADSLVSDGIEAKVTFSLTPSLIAMLADDLLQRRYVRYLEERIAFLEREMDNLRGRRELLRIVRMQHHRFVRCYQVFLHMWGCDLLAAFRHFQQAEVISIIASAATHAYLPLWSLFPELVELQVKVGIEQHRHYFARRPMGFWLPECGFYPGVDHVLHRQGIRFFFLDSHGIWNGEPKPKFGEYAPIHTPAGVVAFGRNRRCHDQVWLKDKGYPGDDVYMEFGGDIGFEWDLEYLFPLTHHRKRIPTGIRFYCVRAGMGKVPYDPALAFTRCVQHADHFVGLCRQVVEELNNSVGREPVIVAMFDTENFGHWWYEGPRWLDLMLRKLACEQETVRAISAEDYLRRFPTNQVVEPSISSWGYQGYSEVWLMGRNHWIYPLLYEAADFCKDFVARESGPVGMRRLALNQYLRELLLAQSSDWAFMMHAQTTQAYAENRVKGHLDNINRLRTQLDEDSLDEGWLDSLQRANNIFGNLDLVEIYKGILFR